MLLKVVLQRERIAPMKSKGTSGKHLNKTKKRNLNRTMLNRAKSLPINHEYKMA